MMAVSLIAAALLASTSEAQSAPAIELLSQADINRDGIITCEEARISRQSRLWSHDLDGDDRLDWSEFRAGLPRQVNGLTARVAFARMDTSHDGQIDRDEIMTAPLVRFDEADTDSDCRLDPAEQAAAIGDGGIQ